MKRVELKPFPASLRTVKKSPLKEPKAHTKPQKEEQPVALQEMPYQVESHLTAAFRSFWVNLPVQNLF